MAISLCVLGAFAVRLRFSVSLSNPGSYQVRQKRVSRQAAKPAKAKLTVDRE